MSLSRPQILLLLALLLFTTVGFAAAWLHERNQTNSLTLSVGDQKLKIETR